MAERRADPTNPPGSKKTYTRQQFTEFYGRGYGAKMWKQAGEGRVVVVTGATGFVAAHLVQQLLEKGYTVRGTTRDVDGRSAAVLKALPGAEKRLSLAKAELLTDGAFDDVVKGALCVFHTASPFYMAPNIQSGTADYGDYTEENLLPPAIEGTLNVLRSCAKAKVGRVVLTSSTAAVYTVYGSQPNNHVYTGDDWSDEKAMREAKNWYCISKTSAEKAAWDFADKTRGLSLATILPTLVLGPMLTPHLNQSAAVLKSMVGKATVSRQTKTMVDVRDVARSHILAYEKGGPIKGQARERYLCIGCCESEDAQVSYLRGITGEGAVPAVNPDLPAKVMGAAPPHATLYDCSPLGRLGLKFRDFHEMASATVADLRRHGHLPPAAQ